MGGLAEGWGREMCQGYCLGSRLRQLNEWQCWLLRQKTENGSELSGNTMSLDKYLHLHLGVLLWPQTCSADICQLLLNGLYVLWLLRLNGIDSLLLIWVGWLSHPWCPCPFLPDPIQPPNFSSTILGVSSIQKSQQDCKLPSGAGTLI